MCGSPIVPSTVATSTDSVASSGKPAPDGSSSGRDQPSPPGAVDPATSGTSEPAAKVHVLPVIAVYGPGASVVGAARSTATVVGSVIVSRVSTRNSTGVSRLNVVNSTADSAEARVSAPTCTSSQIAGTSNSTI